MKSPEGGAIRPNFTGADLGALAPIHFETAINCEAPAGNVVRVFRCKVER